MRTTQKRKNMKPLSLILVLSIFCLSGTTVTNNFIDNQKRNRVFQIDENELLFEELSKEYEKLLIQACNNDVDVASKKWLKTLAAMERYALRWNYYDKLKGTKVWIKVFCSKRGRIEYIAYSVKPSSRDIDTQLFVKFLERFLRAYRVDIRTDSKFSHYSSAEFPLVYRR